MTPDQFLHFTIGCAFFLLGFAGPVLFVIWRLSRKEPTNG